MNAIEGEKHVLLKCPAYTHIRHIFTSLLKDNKVLTESPQKTLGFYVTKVLSH